MKMTGTARIQAVLNGENTDRAPYSFWTHLPHVDLDPVKLAEETYQFYRTYELDFIKTMPNGLFSVEDFGCECDFSEIPLGGAARITMYAVETAEDWERLTEPDVTRGALARELLSLELLLDKVQGDAPVVATVFSPLTTASKMCGPNLIRHLRERPESVKAGLCLIARVTAKFAEEAVKRGCAGIYFANQMATREVLTEDEFQEFGVPYDLMVLNAIRRESWFNILHIHGHDIMHHLLTEYPVQAFNWHIGETAPEIEEYRNLIPGKAIVGGIRRFNITSGNIAEIKRDITEACRQAGSSIILTPGCVIRYPVESRVLHAVRKEIVQSTRRNNVYNYSKTQNKDRHAPTPSEWGFNTKLVHAAQFPDPATKAVSPSIVPAVAYAFPDVESAAACVSGGIPGTHYGRYGNPTTRVLELKVAELEGGEDALGVSSGMAAISISLLAFLKQGDHVIVTKDVYGGTHSFLTSLAPRFGIECSFVDCTDLDEVRRAVKPSTKAMYLETPSNPRLTILDIRALSAIAKESKIPVIVDNTFMTPYLQQPLELGADVVVHSGTKYLNGHGDVIAGFIVGAEEHIRFMRKKIMGDLGQNLNAWESFLILRGLKTMGLRVRQHCSSAQKVAEFLSAHPLIEEVYYPGLPSHPQRELAARQMKGMGGIVSFELKGGFEAGKTFLNSLKLAMISFSLGDPETLVQHPASMTHSSIPADQRQQFGITDGLIRLSVGLEDPEDIIADLEQALKAVADALHGYSAANV